MKAREPDHHREFDFWLGDWDVHDLAGEFVGHPRIRLAVSGRGLREDWRGKSGLVGTSLNAWSDERKCWHQTWIDSAGTLLLLEGGRQGDAMVLEGTTRDVKEGAVTQHRITWSVIDGDPDRVRQHWETSGDGSSWETLFDGRYLRRKRRREVALAAPLNP